MQSETINVPLPAGAAGAWCTVSVAASGGRWWAQAQLTDRARDQVVRQVFLGPLRRGRRRTLLHMPGEAGALSLLFIADGALPGAIDIRPLSRLGASLRLLISGWRSIPKALRGDPLGRFGRLRATLGQAPARKGEAPPYQTWLALYEESCEVSDGPDLQIAFLGNTGAPNGSVTIATPADWDLLRADYVLILGDGETLAPHALARFAHALHAHPDAQFLCADIDEIDAAGVRRSPMFKPQPGAAYLHSGLATVGACVFRRRPGWRHLPLEADAARLALAFQCHPAAMHRIPAILTHLPSSPVPHASRVARLPIGATPLVSIIIPSACRSPHVLRGLRRLTATTDYQCYEILLAITDLMPADPTQATVVAEARRIPNVRILDLGLPEFNYAQVNNLGARQACGEYLLFLNDDLAPIENKWLSNMMAYAVLPDVGAVGACLLYGNDTVQHAGVIMGLAGLCEHAFRLADAEDSGPNGIAHIDREMSAVTAACLLTRASLFAKLGGFDEAFAIALNDVDLCLRIGETGASIIYAASATLYHYESLSLGRHYQGVRAAREVLEVRRLRDRWSAAIADDPFYNPQASLEPGREWQPAFPPRPALSSRLVASLNNNFGNPATNC